MSLAICDDCQQAFTEEACPTCGKPAHLRADVRRVPREVVLTFVEHAQEYLVAGPWRQAVLAFSAGSFIAFGAMLSIVLTVGVDVPGLARLLLPARSLLGPDRGLHHRPFPASRRCSTHTKTRVRIRPYRDKEATPMGDPITFIDLGVGGMTCDDCVVHVAGALESVPGVERATVDLASRSAVVTARPEVESVALATAVRASGQYNVFERRRRGPDGE